MALEHSRFNHIARDPGKRAWVLYNFATGRHVRLDALSYGMYLAAPENPDTPFTRSLEKAGFLVRGDELVALHHATNLACYGSKILMLTICPTMGCNFACPYCFEEHRGGRMSEKTQKDLVAFIEQQLERFSFHSLCVVWFGGEPLLQPGVIASLSQRITRLADAHGVAYTSNIVTNGYNLDAATAQMLLEGRVTGLQVTLDGPNAPAHDATRATRSGKGSFDRIVANLRALSAGFTVKIRCNVGPHNIAVLDEMRQLVQSLNDASPSEFLLVPGIMDADVAKHPENLDDDLKGAGYQSVNRALAELGMVEYDSIGAKMPGRFHGTFCGSQCAHTYVIDEDGDLYRCWEDCGDKAAAFGNVEDFDSFAAGINPRATAYLETAWVGDDPQCGTCPILPLCMGACPHRHKASGIRRCPWFKDDLDAYVLRLVDNCSHDEKPARSENR